MQLALGMQILQTLEQLPNDNRYVFLAKHPGLHLGGGETLASTNRGLTRDELTRSEQEPPEQYLTNRQYMSSAMLHADLLHYYPQIRPFQIRAMIPGERSNMISTKVEH